MEYLNQVGVLTGLAVLALEQILKLKLVPISIANKYPIPVLILLSIGAAIVVSTADLIKDPSSVGEWVLLVATIGLVAAFTYNHTFRNWKELRKTEGSTEG